MAAEQAKGVPGQEGRIEEMISIRVLEAKNLPAPNDLRHSRDTYVCVGLDQEEIFRTATAEKSLTPFYGEEYHFSVPRDFRHLTFYVCESSSLSWDSTLGKVSISHDDLKSEPMREDRWYPIAPLEPDNEVQGKIQLSLNIAEKLVEDGEKTATQHVLSIRVIEGCGLSVCGNNGFSDPYCQVLLLGNAPGMRSEVRRGQVHKRTVNPKFRETFDFPIDGIKSLRNTLFRVSVWHQSLICEDVFMGQVNLMVESLDPTKANTGWYALCPRPLVQGQAPRQSVGSMRIKVSHSLDYIHPRIIYQPLLNLLTASFKHSDPRYSALSMLNDCCKDRAAMGRSLVKIFLSLDKLEEAVRYMVETEVNSTVDPNTLFRGNSLASKFIDEFMKIVGLTYLQRTLQPCIDEIFEARKHCEIDSSKVTEGENLDVNMANLMFFVVKIISAITASARSCPRIMCKVFAILRDTASSKFPDNVQTVRYSSVSGFVFLRFFAPAILNPKLFNLRSEYPSPVVARTLTLISKSVQSLVNIGGPKLTGSLQHKETYMNKLNMELQDQTKAVMDYLEAISDPLGGVEDNKDQMTFREGYLVKRSQGRKKGPKNFKKRFFSLTNDGFSYHKSKGDSPLCFIPSQELLAVERVDESAFSLKFMFQLIQPTRILYMQARNSVEQMEWLTALAKATCSNTYAEFYHSGAFLNGSWTCCGGPVEDKSRGCKPITLAVRMLGLREDIDLERELHSIYKMFVVGQGTLVKMKEEATLQARADGQDTGKLPPRLKTICELFVFIKNLELSTSVELQCKTPRLGTRDAPYTCSSYEAVVLK